MSEEQLELAGMPGPVDSWSTALDADGVWVQVLLDDPDAAAEDLLRAFCSHEVNEQLRDSVLLHPRLAGYDLGQAMAAWPENTRDRAAAVTDDRTVIGRWATSRVPFDRAVAAMNPHCPGDIVLTLAQDTHPGVRANAVCNGNLPRKIRAGIANRDPDPDVRDFTRWIMTTTAGRNLIDGCRYTPTDRDSDESLGRVIVYGMSRAACGPS